MERFAAVDDQYDPDSVESDVFEYWDDVDAYEQTVEHRSDGEAYFFVDGPPYTSGAAHMGTTWNKTLKDVYLRYLRMQGYDVTDRPGYDMHGLPIETKVEERLDFENKKDIEAFGEENFIAECKSFAEEQLEGLQEDFKSFGVWMDWDDPYKTVEPEYMEAAWWGFQQAHEHGLVEQGQRSINQCPRCETAIANNEVEREEVGKPSIYVKFPLSEREADHGEASERASGETASRDGNLVIWTTTPWTIPANTFVAVDGDVTYHGVRAEKDGESELLYIAEPRVEDVLKKGHYEDYEVVEEVTGEEMVGWEYDHPLAEEVPAHASAEGSGQVYTAEYVDAEDQTGLVHSAPGHGEEDFERGQELGLEVFCPVGSDGTYTEAGGDYAGTFVRDANDQIIADLDEHGRLLASESGYTVNEGHCWRCDTGIVRIVTDQWFITITDIKDDLIDNIEDSEWHPQWARDNRFRDFVEDAPDWNVSRQRYWGIPIPIWTPEEWSGEMDDVIVVGDREELAERVDQDVDPETVDIHKGTVDELTITEDGTTYTRVGDVFDVWLDSSVATWGTIAYPSETEAYDELWPADLIMEAHDQTRGWFWSQLGMGSAASGQIPYKEVLMHGWALAEDGRKMSKSLGNIVAPQEAIDRHGADPMRLFLLSQNPQGDDMVFSWEEMEQMERRLNIIWNVFRFPLPYMEMDGFDPEATTLDAVAGDLEVVDEWVLARLQSVKESVTGHFGARKDDADVVEGLETFRQDKGLEALLEFLVEDVSRFYIQAIRERMWEEEDSATKNAAYATLYRVLEETAQLLAPYAPFVAEEMYRTLTGDAGHDSVHMCDWPAVDADLADAELEEHIHVVRAVEKAGSAARQQADRNLRWPVQRIVVDAQGEAGGRVADAVEAQTDLLKERLNARDVELVAPGEAWGELTYTVTADMSQLGPAFGDDAGRVMNAFNDVTLDEPSLDALKAALGDEDWLDTGELTAEMVESYDEEAIEGIEGVGIDIDADDDAHAKVAAGHIYVDSTLTEDIESEGYAREVIRRIQEMRKDLDLDIEARIVVDLAIEDERVDELVRDHEDFIAEEVRADEFGSVDDGHRKTWDVEDVEMDIAIAPVATAEASD